MVLKSYFMMLKSENYCTRFQDLYCKIVNRNRSTVELGNKELFGRPKIVP